MATKDNNGKNMLSTGELAKRLHLRRCQVLYLIDSGVLPEPKCRAGGKRLFSEDEATQAEECLRKPVGNAADADEEQPTNPNSRSCSDSKGYIDPEDVLYAATSVAMRHSRDGSLASIYGLDERTTDVNSDTVKGDAKENCNSSP